MLPFRFRLGIRYAVRRRRTIYTYIEKRYPSVRFRGICRRLIFVRTKPRHGNSVQNTVRKRLQITFNVTGGPLARALSLFARDWIYFGQLIGNVRRNVATIIRRAKKRSELFTFVISGKAFMVGRIRSYVCIFERGRRKYRRPTGGTIPYCSYRRVKPDNTRLSNVRVYMRVEG